MEALEIVRLLAKEFDSVEDTEAMKYIELEKPNISKKVFGSSYEKALALLTAHRMKMNGLGSSEYGTIAESIHMTSFSEGESSVTFAHNQANNSQVDGEYTLTTYGLQFLTLKRTVVIPIMVGGEGNGR